MHICPYLLFNGNARQAMTFYQQVLGGNLQISPFSDMPDFEENIDPVHADRVMNAQLTFDDGLLMASDGCPDQPVGPMEGFAVALEFPDADRAADIFERLGEGGTVLMPWAPTFWAAGFGMFKDQYGVTWMISGGTVQ